MTSAPAPDRRATAPITGSGVMLLVAVCSAAMLIIMADLVAATMMIAALADPRPGEPVVPDELAHMLGVGGLEWAATVSLVSFAAFLTVGGQLADRLGRRLVLGIGATFFAVATLALTAAPGWLELLAARLAQGIGGALMVPASLGMLVAHLPGPRLRVAIGWWSGAAGLGSVLMHLTGAALAAAAGWRALYWPSLVLATVLVCALPTLPRDRRTAGRLPDLIGAVLLASGIGAVVLVICRGMAWGWTSPRILIVTSLGLAALCAAVLRSRTQARPALHLELWRQPDFRWGWSLSALYGLLALPVLALAPSYLADEVGTWSASHLLAPMSGAVLLAGPLAGAASRRWGSCATTYAGAVIVIASGTGLVSALRTGQEILALAVLAALGSGFGILSAVAAAEGGRATLPDQPSAASAASMTARQGGGALGVAGASVVLEHPIVTGPAAGYLSVLTVCVTLAGLCALGAVIRPLIRTRHERRTRVRKSAHPVHSPVDQPSTSEMALVPHQVLAQLREALLDVGQAADAWLHAHATPASPPSPSMPPQVSPFVATGAIARRCACHPRLDALEATLWHTAARAPRPHNLISIESTPSGEPHAR